MLIIIGLIVGGVLGGQSLIKSAELQRVVNEHNQYQTAINAFRLEFNALPGDMNDAFDYWGANCADGKEATCNGDGDGEIENNKSKGGGNEGTLVWNHLSLAGIVPGNYTGLPDNDYHNGRNPGVNVPKTFTQDNGAYNFGISNDTAIRPNWKGKAFLHVVATFKTGSTYNSNVFSPKNTKAIDTKMDDGEPIKGKFVAGGFGDNSSWCIKKDDGQDITNIQVHPISTCCGEPDLSGDLSYVLDNSKPACFTYYEVF